MTWKSASRITSSVPPATHAAQDHRRVIAKSDEVFEQEKPDALLLYGDTNSCLAVICRQAPQDPGLPHGSRQPLLRPARAGRAEPQGAGSPQRHQPGVDRARSPLPDRRRAFRPRRIIKTGSHMQEVLEHYMPKIEQSDVLERCEPRARTSSSSSARTAKKTSIRRTTCATCWTPCEPLAEPMVSRSSFPRTRARASVWKPLG